MSKFIHKFLKGFVYAFHGIKSGFAERNMRVHGVAAIVVICLSFFLHLVPWVWCIVLILIGIVMSAELMNTAIEDVCNHCRDELGLDYTSSRLARDTAAGAVLVVAIVAALVGSVIFVPKILALFPSV
jgi:undecaprenol kinase